MLDRLDNYRLTLRDVDFLPIVTGGMGVDISNAELALEIARLGGIGHISDAMSPFVSDRRFGTRYQNEKGKMYESFRGCSNKKGLIWDFDVVKEASFKHVNYAMSRKVGSGLIFVNVMEKLNMGAPRETLQARLRGAMDAGVDGITLSAGLHTGTLQLVEDHPRFCDVFWGIIVSSARALKIFLRSAHRANRLPDYIVVEGPLAGGHLGFGLDWASHSLSSILSEILLLLAKDSLNIPVIVAGGVFTGSDAVRFINIGASGVQVATRFTITKECGLPDKVKQIYLNSTQEDVVVNFTSPTGYPMRMLRCSPSLSSIQAPNCESLGYILDANGDCCYLSEYEKVGFDDKGKKLPVTEKMCICSHFMKFQCYTCGDSVYRLKNTTIKLPDGSYYLPSAEHIFLDYLHSADDSISLPVFDSVNM